MYLGSTVTNNGTWNLRSTADVTLLQALQSLWKLLWRHRTISCKTKLCICNASVLSCSMGRRHGYLIRPSLQESTGLTAGLSENQVVPARLKWSAQNPHTSARSITPCSSTSTGLAMSWLVTALGLGPGPPSGARARTRGRTRTKASLQPSRRILIDYKWNSDSLSLLRRRTLSTLRSLERMYEEPSPSQR